MTSSSSIAHQTSESATEAYCPCVHTCSYKHTSESCMTRTALSTGGGAFKGHVQNPRLHPNCTKDCPGHTYLALLHTSQTSPMESRQIRLCYVLPPSYNLEVLLDDKNESTRLVFLEKMHRDTFSAWREALPGLEKAAIFSTHVVDALATAGRKRRKLANSAASETGTLKVYDALIPFMIIAGIDIPGSTSISGNTKSTFSLTIKTVGEMVKDILEPFRTKEKKPSDFDIIINTGVLDDPSLGELDTLRHDRTLVTLSSEVTLWPSLNEVHLGSVDKWVNEKILDDIASSMKSYRPRVWLSKDDVDWTQRIIAKRTPVSDETQDVRQVTRKNADKVAENCPAYARWYFQEYNPIIKSAGELHVLCGPQSVGHPISCIYLTKSTETGKTLRRVNELPPLRSLEGFDDNVIVFNRADLHAQAGRTHFDKFITQFLKIYIAKEKAFLSTAPSTITHVGVRLDVSLARDSSNRQLFYYVNKVARYPEACLFLRDDLWVERAVKLAIGIRTSLTSHLEHFEKIYGKK